MLDSIDLKDYDSVTAEISRLEKQKKLLEDKIQQTDDPKVCKQEADIVIELSLLYDAKESLLKQRSLIRNKTKMKILKNFRILHENCDVKIGVIEKESGNSIGYVSRLEREENLGLPNLEFLMTAAKTLNVPIDYLVYADLDALTPTEVEVVEFLTRVAEDTRNDKLMWDEVCKPSDSITKIEYDSPFFPDKNMIVVGICYEAELPGTKNRIEITCVGELEDEESVHFEVLFKDYKSKRNPICSTANTCETVARAIKDVYREVLLASAHVHINEEAKETISSYLKYSDQLRLI